MRCPVGAFLRLIDLGRIIAALNCLAFFGAVFCQSRLPYLLYVEYSGLPSAFIAGFLIYGAFNNQCFPILVWMIIVSIKSFVDILFGIWFVIGMVNLQEENSIGLWIELILTFANISFQLVGIVHAKRELEGTEGYAQIPSGVAEVDTSA